MRMQTGFLVVSCDPTSAVGEGTQIPGPLRLDPNIPAPGPTGARAASCNRNKEASELWLWGGRRKRRHDPHHHSLKAELS